MSTIELDSERCSGHAMCSAVAPDIYDLDDDGYCVLAVNEVDGDQRDRALAGADACPEQALKVID